VPKVSKNTVQFPFFKGWNSGFKIFILRLRYAELYINNPAKKKTSMRDIAKGVEKSFILLEMASNIKKPTGIGDD